MTTTEVSLSLINNFWEDTGKNYIEPLNAPLDQAGLIPESQCGFRKDRGTIDMIFTAKQLQQKWQEQNKDFIDLTKGFDTVVTDFGK